MSACDACCRFVSLRRLTWAPQRRIFLLGVPGFHVKSVIARWVQDTQTCIQRWCLVRLAAAVAQSTNRRKYFNLQREKRCQKVQAAIVGAWRSFAVACRVVRSHLRKKFTFDLTQVCARYFLIWKQMAHVARGLHLKAKTKHRFIILRTQIHRWHIRVVFRRSLAAATSRRVHSVQLRSFRCFLCEWNRRAKYSINLKVCSMRLSGSHQKALLRKSFCSWLLGAKKLRILKLSRHIVSQEEAATRSAICIARFWTNMWVSRCFKNWAASTHCVFSRKRCVIQRSAAKRLHLVLRAWLNVTSFCRRRRASCSLLVERYRCHLQRLIYCAWAVSARRASYARLWLEALCGRWRDGLFVRQVCAVIAKWHLYARACRFSRLKSQRAKLKMEVRANIIKARTMLCWQNFRNFSAHKRRMSKTAQLVLQRKTQAHTRRQLSKWLQYSKQRRQMRILMCSLERACERMLQSKSLDILQLKFTKWHQFVVKERARRASCFRVELMAQVCLLLIHRSVSKITLPQIQRHTLSRLFRMWSDCVFRFACSFANSLLHSLTTASSARERNAVWLLEKARKANTKIFASTVPEAFWNEPAHAGLTSGAAVAGAVHRAWDIAARVPKDFHSRGLAAHAASPTSDGIAYGRSIGSDVAAKHVCPSLNEHAPDRSRDLGEGMQRLRLCVSLLQKQVHVSDQRRAPRSCFSHFSLRWCRTCRYTGCGCQACGRY
jgi:hypothetical protein